MANPGTIWDRDGMMERIGNDEEIAVAVLEGFLTTIPEQVDLLEQFLKDGNINGIAHTSHSLKGVAATVGGELLRKAALAVEHAGKEGDLDLAREYFVQFKAEFDKLFEIIRASDLNQSGV
jgi:two-component system, sensor histidine kinase and response regulator